MKLLLLLMLIASQGLLAEPHCGRPISKLELNQLIDQVKNDYFPKLQNINFKVHTFKSTDYFLKTCIHPKSVLKSHKKRNYGIEINENLFKCSPGDRALEAIIVHELQHIQDYYDMTSLQIINLGIKYSLNSKFHASYERQTDEAALKMGMAGGLKEYRLWIYQWLTPKELAKKRKYYYTPEEIDASGY